MLYATNHLHRLQVDLLLPRDTACTVERERFRAKHVNINSRGYVNITHYISVKNYLLHYVSVSRDEKVYSMLKIIVEVYSQRVNIQPNKVIQRHTSTIYFWVLFLRFRVYGHPVIFPIVDTNRGTKVTDEVLSGCDTYAYAHWGNGGRVEIQHDAIMYLCV